MITDRLKIENALFEFGVIQFEADCGEKLRAYKESEEYFSVWRIKGSEEVKINDWITREQIADYFLEQIEMSYSNKGII